MACALIGTNCNNLASLRRGNRGVATATRSAVAPRKELNNNYYSDLSMRVMLVSFIMQVRAVSGAGDGEWANVTLGLQTLISACVLSTIIIASCTK